MSLSVSGPQQEPTPTEEELKIAANLVYYARIMLLKQSKRDFPRKEELELMADTMLSVSNFLNKYTCDRANSLVHAQYFELK